VGFLLDTILHRLARKPAVRHRTVFLVDHNGRPRRGIRTQRNYVPGADVSSNSLVAQVKALPQDLRNTETVRFADHRRKKNIRSR